MSIILFLNCRGFHFFEGYNQQSTQQIADLINLTNKPNINVLEIGFNAGYFTEVFLQNNKDLNLTSFDLGEHDYTTSAKEYIDITYPNKHILILGDSRITIPIYYKNNKDTKFDIIFINGNHNYKSTKANIENCFHLAHKDTIIILNNTIFTPELAKSYTVESTRNWVEHLEQKKMIELNKKDYYIGQGMSWGKYILID